MDDLEVPNVIGAVKTAASALRLSAVAPLHNEAECVEAFVAETMAAFEFLGSGFELICVDDGSIDQTPILLRDLLRRTERLRVLRLGRRQGQSAALVAGIAAASGRYVGLIDADLQNDPEDLAQMLRQMESSVGVDALMGWRRIRRDGRIRRLSSLIANRIARRLTDDRLHDAGCGLKVVRSEVLRGIPRFNGMHRFLSPLVRLGGARVAEVEVAHRARRSGVSKYGHGLGRALPALVDALGILWLRRRYLSPEPAVELVAGSDIRTPGK